MIKSKYKRLKICKYSFEISKICILGLSMNNNLKKV